MKMKVMHHVESLYGFDTSQAPEVISRNARHAQALLTAMAFIYRVSPIILSSAAHRVSHPYRNPTLTAFLTTHIDTPLSKR